MPIDPYSPCPGGLEKKIKFCCHDLVHELDKIDRMIAADQRAACLEYVEKLDAKHPGRACLVTTKADLLRELGRSDEAQQAVQNLLGQNSSNPVALAEAAILACENDDVPGAAALVQQAFATNFDTLPNKLVEALVRVAEGLLASGEMVAGRAHLMLYLMFVEGDESAMELLGRLNSAPSISPLLKEEVLLASPPENAPWKKEHEAAMEMVNKAAWGEGANRLEQLAGRYADAPVLWRNAAVLRARLGHNEAASRDLRSYASLDIPSDDAIEAEALAQLLDPNELDHVELVRVRQDIHDMERITEILASDRRFGSVPVPAAGSDPENPPPKAVYLLMDRPMSDNGQSAALSEMPLLLGQVMIFGRQTDREARLELFADRGARLDQARGIIAEFSFGLLGPASEEVVEKTPLVESLLRSNRILPESASHDQRMRLRQQHLDEAAFQQWPATPLDVLGGQTPRQAAKQTDRRRPLLAAILNLELQCQSQSLPLDLNRLRRDLGLPEPQVIEIDEAAIDTTPLVRLSRVDVSALSNAGLLRLVQRASIYGAVAALRAALEEVIRRPEPVEQLSKAAAYGQLAHLQNNPSQSIEYLDKARQAAEAAGGSTARWDLMEINFRLERGEPDEVIRLINHVAQEHINEPGVRQSLMGVMIQLGLARPDGTMVAPRAAEPAGVVAPGASDEGAGKIWTPDSARGGEKPALWLPGS